MAVAAVATVVQVKLEDPEVAVVLVAEVREHLGREILVDLEVGVQEEAAVVHRRQDQ